MVYGKITTVTELRKAVKKAKLIFIRVQFGLSERWVSISKREAEYLVNGINADLTPQEAEMRSGYFGTVTEDGAELSLG